MLHLELHNCSCFGHLGAWQKVWNVDHRGQVCLHVDILVEQLLADVLRAGYEGRAQQSLQLGVPGYVATALHAFAERSPRFLHDCISIAQLTNNFPHGGVKLPHFLVLAVTGLFVVQELLVEMEVPFKGEIKQAIFNSSASFSAKGMTSPWSSNFPSTC